MGRCIVSGIYRSISIIRVDVVLVEKGQSKRFMFSKRNVSVFLFVLALGLGWFVGSLQDTSVNAQSDKSLDRIVQSLDEKLDRVLRNQSVILKKLDQIWKYK
jgi:hypothetical protein